MQFVPHAFVETRQRSSMFSPRSSKSLSAQLPHLAKLLRMIRMSSKHWSTHALVIGLLFTLVFGRAVRVLLKRRAAARLLAQFLTSRLPSRVQSAADLISTQRMGEGSSLPRPNS